MAGDRCVGLGEGMQTTVTSDELVFSLLTASQKQ